MKLESKATNKWCFRSNKEELLAIHLLDFLFFAASRNFFLIFIEILLIYNVMLVSNTQKIESVVFFFQIHFSELFFRFLSIQVMT